jgi:hypothetical protein
MHSQEVIYDIKTEGGKIEEISDGLEINWVNGDRSF